MKVLLIVNASASSVSARRQVIIHRMLSEDHDLQMVETNRRGHATKFALDAARRGVEAVVVFGGDGTLNEVANGLVGTDCALAPLPGGSTNVFARTLGLSDDPVEATTTTIEALAAQSIQRIGLGSVNGRHFLFHTGVGWDAMLVRQVEKRSELKRYLGHPLFIWAGLEAWFRLYDRKVPHFRVVFPDGSTVENGFFSVIQNSNPYTYVGTRPFNLSAEVRLDGPLCAMTLTELDSWSFLRLMFASLRSRDTLTRSTIVDYRPDVTSMVMEMHHPTPYQVDGDDLGDTERLEFHHHPEIMNLVVPVGFIQ